MRFDEMFERYEVETFDVFIPAMVIHVRNATDALTHKCIYRSRGIPPDVHFIYLDN